MNSTFANRLISARRQAGFSQDELVARIGEMVKKTAIAKYERGEMMPKPDVIEALARALDQPVDYFFKKIELTITQEEFRAKASLGARAEDQLRHRIIQATERYVELEKLANASPVFKNPFEGMIISTKEQLETFAIKLRQQWNLGDHPIAGVMTLLEEQGIRVIDLEVDTNDFEGFSAIANQIIPIIVVRSTATTERRRFTALHELAHLLFKFDESLTPKEVERLCHIFAGAMLIPRNVFIETYGESRTRFAKKDLDIAKDKYGISGYAFIMRAFNLGVLSPFSLPQMRKYVTLHPLEMHIGSNTSIDKPTRFDQLILKALYEGYISLTKGAELSGLGLQLFIKHYTENAI